MNQKVDFLIRYEHKIRELESVMLLKLELERRGYTVGLVCNYEHRHDYEPKVLIVPAGYYTEHFMYEMCKYSIRKIANLQLEQLFQSRNEENLDSPFNIYGYGRKILHFLWGKQVQHRLCYGGLDVAHTVITGQLNTDLLRGKFKDQLITKETLACRYNLDFQKKWYLFLSSFAYCNMDAIQVHLTKKVLGLESYNYFKQLSDESRDSILRWFQNALMTHPDTIIIYRPHPDELNDEQLMQMVRDYPNFYVIADLAMKHWVNACDKVYNWYSTGQVDVVLLHKPYRFLRPYVIKEDVDYKLFLGMDSIKDAQAFQDDFTNMEYRDIINRSLFDSYYYIPQNYIYQNICDYLEQMLLTDKYDIKLNFKENLYVGLLTNKIRLIDAMKKSIGKNLFMNIKNMLKPVRSIDIEFQKAIADNFDKNVANQKDIDEIEARLKPLIYE